MGVEISHDDVVTKGVEEWVIIGREIRRTKNKTNKQTLFQHYNYICMKKKKTYTYLKTMTNKNY